VSEVGARFINAAVLKCINRAKVNKLIAALLERVKKINADDNLCHFIINEIRLFGSAMDGKAESFGDIDICYVMARRKTAG
jgi:predicted nucleotidyltransferase